MVICLEQGADLHVAQLMPLPLTISCFSKIQIGFTFLVPAHPGSPGKRAVKRVGVCVCVVASGAAGRANVGLCPVSGLLLVVRLLTRPSGYCSHYACAILPRDYTIRCARVP